MSLILSVCQSVCSLFVKFGDFEVFEARCLKGVTGCLKSVLREL